MTKKHEKLVEEIADYLQASYAMGQHDYKLGVGYGKTPRKWDKDKAKKIIALTLKAVADGMPLPNEVGRGTVDDEIGALQLFLSLMPPNGARLIALRPTGTGKEGQEEE